MEQNAPVKSAKKEKKIPPFILLLVFFISLFAIGFDYLLNFKDHGLDWFPLIIFIPLLMGAALKYIYKLTTGADEETARRKSEAWPVKLMIFGIFIILMIAFEKGWIFPKDRCGKTVLELMAAEKRYFTDYGSYTDKNLYSYVNTGSKNKLSSDKDLEKWVSKVCDGRSFDEPWTLNLIQVCDNCQNFRITASSRHDRGYYVASPHEQQDLQSIRSYSPVDIDKTPLGRRERAIAHFLIALSAIGIPVSYIGHIFCKQENRKSLL